MSFFVSVLASGIATGAIIALAALSFLLLYKATGVFNFAMGDLMTLAAYLSVWVSGQHAMPVLPGYILAIIILFGVGVVIERIAYAPLRGRPTYVVVISTLGAAMALRAGIGLWQGTLPVQMPSLLGFDSFELFGATISLQRVLIVVVTAVLIVGLLLLFNHTQLGRQVRSVAADRQMAQLNGIRVTHLSMLAFGASAALAGIAGLLVGPLAPVDLNLGFGIMLSAFAAAIIGGFGSLGGVVLGALILGLAQQTLGAYVLRDYKDIYPFLLMIVVIAIRPEGLFTRPGRARL